MTTLSAKISDKGFLDKLRAVIAPSSYIECGNCESIKADAKELARALNFFSDGTDEDMHDFASEFLDEITESSPEKFDSYEEWEKWEVANRHRFCPFLSPEPYGGMYIKYDSVVIYCDPDCNCFNKKTIKDAISLSY